MLHGHLLVEREADQQRHRVRGDQRIGLVGFREVQTVGQGGGYSSSRSGRPKRSKAAMNR
jgi:hypothetical protein